MRFLIFLLFLSSTNASPKTRNRIVGGSPTTIQEYPYVANMQYGWGAWWTQLCGGSLITNFHVLSAAHCYESVTPLLWRVILGSTMRSGEGGSEHYVSDIILHENYDEPVLDNDIAIIRLSNAAQFSNTVQVVSIAGLNYNLANGATVTALGWGHLESNGFSPEELHHVDMEVINQQLCAERYAYLKTQPQFSDWPDISPGMICAGALDIGGKDACQGDSGGPLVHNKDILVGITSWGFGCADAFYPGVSARVSHYANWIVANAN